MSRAKGAPPSILQEGPNAEAFQSFMGRADQGPVVMQNLLKFKPEGGAEMYSKYMEAVGPHLMKVGGRVLYLGRPDELLIGHETWDSLILVEYPTRGAFVAMVTSP